MYAVTIPGICGTRRVNRIAWLLSLALALPWVLGIIVDGTDPERYAQAPEDDPGWANVGRRGATSAVYLGRGWVLTARHSLVGDVVFGESVHLPVGGTMVWLDDPSGAKADLILFRIEPVPELPSLRLRRRAPPPRSKVMMVGYGMHRGEPLEWNGVRGFRFVENGTRHWGMNLSASRQIDVQGPHDTLTRCFRLEFEENGVHEALAGSGDSGGAVFVRGPKSWRLGGIMLSVARNPGQSDGFALFGNVTHAADLSVYSRQILEVTGLEAAAP